MTTSPVHEQHQIALAINNIGVILLQRGCTQQAIEVLHSAVAVMKYGVFTKVDDSRQFCAFTLLHESSEKLAQAAYDKHRSTCVQPLVYSEDFLSTVMSAMETGPSSESLHPIIVEGIDTEDEQSIHMSSGIFLYNYGLAQYLRSRDELSHSVQSREVAMSNAVRLVEMAVHIVLQNMSECMTNVSEGAHCAMGLGGLLLTTLAQLHIECSDMTGASKAMQNASSILMVLQEYYGENAYMRLTAAAAA
jgi:hypothetical protein